MSNCFICNDIKNKWKFYEIGTISYKRNKILFCDDCYEKLTGPSGNKSRYIKIKLFKKFISELFDECIADVEHTNQSNETYLSICRNKLNSLYEYGIETNPYSNIPLLDGKFNKLHHKLKNKFKNKIILQ